jgi:hypothetical protein
LVVGGGGGGGAGAVVLGKISSEIDCVKGKKKGEEMFAGLL